ncbi:MAG: M20/M25/M40 family metallo-hydrolase, partial [Steroidobacteraceae bacterium]|nr:M20/M25/M40 family metallo-hydrolase [Steroidobacteraceae bacterium]MDW8260009.1 M20/M25/M40 family metallo-hydrolase [Gammaproteobacteria bacterium]
MRCVTIVAVGCALALVPIAARAANEPRPFDRQARALFAELIALDTSREGRKVNEAAELLARRFRAAGFPEGDIRILPFADAASFVVRYRGRPNSRRKPVLLLAHLDVVPARRADWQRDPFELIEENGYFFGRGTSDNKDGVVAIATALLRLKAEGFVPQRDLVFYASGDEETAQMTTLDVARNRRELIDAEFALNSDGGGGTLDEGSDAALYYELQTAEKTYADFSWTARNPGGHSSQPRADNAIYELAAALERLRAFRFPPMSNEATRASLKLAGAMTGGELGAMLERFAANPADTVAADYLFDQPAYVGQTRTTCVATMLSGGHAPNALPQTATATINCRIFPGMPVAAVHAALQSIAGAAIEVRAIGEPMWSDPSPLREDIVRAVAQALAAIGRPTRIVPAQSSGTTDGVVFRNVGIPTYGVSGMFMKNSDNFAHGLNERVPVRGFYDNLEFWYRLLKALAGR